MASGLQEDPGQAYLYAQQARKLAARVGVVREACGIAAYRAGEWAEALAELRAARRLTGRDTALPLMADSERALGRLDRALAIVQAPPTPAQDRATQIELAIVESGIRRDQGMADAALLALQVPELTDRRIYPWSARLFYAYADTLLDAGRREEARDWFARAAAADATEDTDAAERFDELDDVIIEDLGEEEDLDEEEDLGEQEVSPEEPAPADVSAEAAEADVSAAEVAQADVSVAQADVSAVEPPGEDLSPREPDVRPEAPGHPDVTENPGD